MENLTPIVVGNWKLHNSISAATSLAETLKHQLGDRRDVQIGVAPVFTSLAAVTQCLRDSSIFVGGQNCFYEDQGAWTGEVSAPQLVDAGCHFVLVGHSERRLHFGDSDEIVARKARAALHAGLHTIICVGESESERDTGETHPRIAAQLSTAMTSLVEADLDRVVIAYEPIWAIGTGRTATPAQAQDVHAFIRDQLSQQYGPPGARVRLQYGGSVKPSNAKALLSQPDINGALVGGASLQPDDFTAIVNAARC